MNTFLWCAAGYAAIGLLFGVYTHTLRLGVAWPLFILFGLFGNVQ